MKAPNNNNEKEIFLFGVEERSFVCLNCDVGRHDTAVAMMIQTVDRVFALNFNILSLVVASFLILQKCVTRCTMIRASLRYPKKKKQKSAECLRQVVSATSLLGREACRARMHTSSQQRATICIEIQSELFFGLGDCIVKLLSLPFSPPFVRRIERSAHEPSEIIMPRRMNTFSETNWLRFVY